MNWWRFLWGALLALCASPALAQSQPAPPPIRSPLDGNGVNLANGQFQLSATDLSIGSLSFKRFWTGEDWYDNWFISLAVAGGSASVYMGGETRTFTLNGSVYISGQGDGSTLVDNGATYTYTTSDGAVYTFDKAYSNDWYASPLGYGRNTGIPATKIVLPSGDTITLTYKTYTLNPYTYVRLQSVNSSDGYQLKFGYATSTSYRLASITGINNAIDYCDPAADSCSGLTQPWPQATYSYDYSQPNATVATVTDPMGRATRYTFSFNLFQFYGLRRPGSSSDDLVVTYNPYLHVSAVEKDGLTWNYSWPGDGGRAANVAVTDPLSHQRVLTVDSTLMVILTDKDALSRTSTFEYDSFGRVTKATAPEGGYTQFAYDARGNMTTATHVAKTGSGLANIVTSAAYPSSCTNPKICNKPTSTTDARGNVTSYTYDPTHGGVLTVTAPAVNGIHPQTRYTYTALHAYYKNSSGQIVASSVAAWRRTGVSTCRTTSSCSGGADETKSITTYGSTGVANNLLPTSVSKGAGDNSLTATTATSYDSIGNVIAVDGPLSGTADATRAIYNADRQLTEVIGPDPDGVGSLKNRAKRFTYNVDGLVTLTEQGTANADGSGFVSLQQVATSYDSSDRKIEQTAQANGVTYSAQQWSYDEAGRLDCTAIRMNPNTFTSLPASACSLGVTGNYGPDRISRNSYDTANELLKTTVAYGVSGLQRDEVTYTYTPDGKVGSVKDGKGNLTTYFYDGFDRLSKTEYPSPTSVGQSNPSDYEQLGYDPNGNVTSRRLRDGNTINFTYDALNRRTLLDLPSTSNPTDRDVTYSYDLLGHLLYADQGDGHNVQYTWDALGRQLTQSGNAGTKTSTYDLAGRRTRLIWQDGFYVTYDYDNVGEMTAIRENGATTGIGVLATFTYDDLGERTKRALGNGTSTTYGYDPISRLTSLSLAGGTNTDTITLSNYSPAREIGGRAETSDAYAWTQGVNVSRTYTANGLNQYLTIAGVSQGYDARGNLSSSGGVTYVYNSKNQMSAAGSNSFYYDALGRLDISGGVRLDYDGTDLITELSSTFAILRRYVFGPGADEPIVWYEGSGTTDRRWMDQDERGSITRITSDTGATIALDSYDEYGIPASTNMGRFQYTGQAWLPEAGLYYYKARMYSPTLGRFMQTDPIGYGDGLNWYNYVGGNPIAGTDPTGTVTDAFYKIMCRVDGWGGTEISATQSYNAVTDGGGGSGMVGNTGAADNGSGWYHSRVIYSDGTYGTWSAPYYKGDGFNDFGGFQASTAGSVQNDLAPQTGEIVVTGKRQGTTQIASNSVTVPIPQYPIPFGYFPDPMDSSQRYVLDKKGRRVLNPRYQHEIDNFHLNMCGIFGDLGIILGGSIGGLGEVGGAAGGVLGGGSAASREFCSG